MFQLSHLMPWNWVWASTLSCKKLFWPTSIMTYSLLLHQKDQHRTSICCFLVWSSMFVLLCSFTKKKTGSVFPAFCHATFHHPLITCCNCKIKRDLPVSWSLIEILSSHQLHQGITWDCLAHAQHQYSQPKCEWEQCIVVLPQKRGISRNGWAY